MTLAARAGGVTVVDSGRSLTAHEVEVTAHGLTANISAALAAATSPSASNSFLTKLQPVTGASNFILSDSANNPLVKVSDDGAFSTWFPSSGLISMPMTDGGDFNMLSGGGIYDVGGTYYFDPILHFGYNVKNAGVARDNTKPVLFHEWTLDYYVDGYQGVGNPQHYMELNLNMSNAGGSQSYRVIGMAIDRNNPNNYCSQFHTIAGTGRYSIIDRTGTVRMQVNENGWLGAGTAPSYPLHVVYNADGAQNFVMTNSSTGTSASTGVLVGQDGSSRYLYTNVFGSGYSNAALALSAAITAQSGLTNGLSFIVAANAPLTFHTNNTLRLTLDGSGNFTSAVNVLTPFVNLSSGTGNVLKMPATHVGTFGNYMCWMRVSDSWESARIGAASADAGAGYKGRLVLGANKGDSPTDIVKVMSLDHNGTNVIINVAGLPTSAAGLTTGDLWSNGGVLTIA